MLTLEDKPLKKGDLIYHVSKEWWRIDRQTPTTVRVINQQLATRTLTQSDLSGEGRIYGTSKPLIVWPTSNFELKKQIIEKVLEL